MKKQQGLFFKICIWQLPLQILPFYTLFWLGQDVFRCSWLLSFQNTDCNHRR
ncbi:unnamed protein product, partial [Vitis vinifera]|uniref:Uncharacterized protein n=1 Tax=Vitis vinifera TaxID=29760 RepID=D7U873_VITVI